MSKLHDLITQLCPDGVPYKKLGDVFDSFNGMGGVSNKWADDGNCQFIDYKNVYNNTKVDVSNTPYATVKKISNQRVIKQGDILCTCASETPNECALSAVVEDNIRDNIFLDDHLFGLRVKEEYANLIDTTFINYYFTIFNHRKNVFKAVRGVTRYYIDTKAFMRIPIPLPPLPVQSEVVRILDSFTELEAELEAELAGRIEQYEYYRDYLLDKKNLEAMDGKPVEMMKLGDFSSYIRGITYNKGQETRHDGWKVLRANNIDLTTGNLVLDDIKTVSSTVKVPETKILKSNDILICAGSGSKEHVGKVSFINHDLSFTFGGFMGVIRTNSNDISSRFLYYILKSNIFRRYLSSELNGTTINNLNSRIVNNFELPVPSLATQERVVDILDRFDALTTSLTDGIPAEIEMRREQYEYYRSRLLDFPRLPEDSNNDGE